MDISREIQTDRVFSVVHKKNMIRVVVTAYDNGREAQLATLVNFPENIDAAVNHLKRELQEELYRASSSEVEAVVHQG